MGTNDTPVSQYEMARRAVEVLAPFEQLRLIAELVARLSGDLDPLPRRSLLELQGLGKSIWHGIDVEQYLRQERSSWNGQRDSRSTSGDTGAAFRCR